MRRAAGCAAAVAFGLGPVPAAGQGLEYPVKAAFLAKFGAFAGWPSAALERARTLKICVVGQDPFGAALERTVQGQSVSGRPLELVRLPHVQRESGCHLLYAAGSDRQSVADTLAAVRGEPVLTVTDAATGGPRGMIHFVVFQDRVRFYVDLGQANRSGVGLSSKLLSLALGVRR